MIASNRRSRQWRSGRLPSRQRGIALLVAVLLVALGTIIAAAIAYENAMTARRGAATFALDQSVLIGEAAESLAAYGLRGGGSPDLAQGDLSREQAESVAAKLGADLRSQLARPRPAE